MSKVKCVIFGAGGRGQFAYQQLQDEYSIIAFSDNDEEKWGGIICGCKIIPPKELQQLEDVMVIIASRFYPAINRQLRRMGVTANKVFCYEKVHGTIACYLLDIQTDYLFSDCVYDSDRDYPMNNDNKLNPCSEKRILVPKGEKIVLFVAYYFPPMRDAAVQRSQKFVKYLGSCNYTPVVLTAGDCWFVRNFRDDSLLEDLSKDIQIIRIDDSCWLPECISAEEQQQIFDIYNFLVPKIDWKEELQNLYSGNLGENMPLLPDNAIAWVNQCLQQLENYLDPRQIDLVFTTGNPFSDFLIGYFLKKKYHTKWVADYRDPWASNDYYNAIYWNHKKEVIGLQKELEKSIIKDADRIIVTARESFAQFARNYGYESNKIIEITNGYDEDDFRDIGIKAERNQAFTICYNGRIYADRNPVSFMQSVNKLIRVGQISSEEICWKIQGDISAPIMKKLREEDTYHIMEYLGYRSHVESLQEAANADMLLLFGSEEKGVYPGKVFEYLRLRRNILCYAGEGNVLEELLIDTGTGQCFRYDDIDGPADYILHKYVEWKQGRSSLLEYSNKIKKYSRRELTSKLADVFDEILNHE